MHNITFIKLRSVFIGTALVLAAFYISCGSDKDGGSGDDGKPSQGDIDCERKCLDEKYQGYASCDYETWDCIEAGEPISDCKSENESCKELADQNFENCVLKCDGCFGWRIKCGDDCYAPYSGCFSDCEDWRKLCGDECYRQYENCLKNCEPDDEDCETECSTSYGRCVGTDCEQGYKDCMSECIDSDALHDCIGDCFDAFYECATWFDFSCEQQCDTNYAFPFFFCLKGVIKPERCRTKTDEWLACVTSCY